jgi:hypothetical protein
LVRLRLEPESDCYSTGTITDLLNIWKPYMAQWSLIYCSSVGGKGTICAYLHGRALDRIKCELGSQCIGPPQCKYHHAPPDKLMNAHSPQLHIWEPD